MMNKTAMALAAMAILAGPSAALADKDVSDVGGFHFGPLGQPMGAPQAWGAAAPWGYYYSSSGSSPYAYAPRGPYGPSWSEEP